MSSDAQRGSSPQGAGGETSADPSPEAVGEGEFSPRLASLLASTSVAPAAVVDDTPRRVQGAAPAFAELGLALVIEVSEAVATLRVGGAMVDVPHGTVHPAVLRTACERGEPVLVERGADGSLRIAGALRTQPTPGVDAVDEIDLEAKRIRLRATEEITMEATQGLRGSEEVTTARLALRAAGELETYATRILSKAEEVHKIIGRMLRLN